MSAQPPDMGEASEEPKQRSRAEGRRLARALVRDFARNSTLHGLRYLTERGLSALEKVFWGFVFMSSLVLCVWAMSNVWLKWQTSPIVITTSEPMSSSEVPFPAVTVCPQSKLDQNLFNYTQHFITYEKFLNQLREDKNSSMGDKIKRLENFTEQTAFMSEFVNLYNLICSQYIDEPLNIDATNYTSVQNFTEVIGLKARNIFVKWQNKFIIRDDNAVAPVLLEEGVCFTFNSLATDEIFHMDRIHNDYSYLNATSHRKGWSPEDGYFDTGNDVYPRRGRMRSKSPPLKIDLLDYVKREFLCGGAYQGYKVYFHHPADLAQSSRNHHLVEPNERVSFSIKVNVITTSNSLINYPIHVRQCYFPSEKRLEYFKAYTPSNCLLECLANRTLARCGCVAFHMPRNDSTSLCMSPYERICVSMALQEHFVSEELGVSGASECRCLPSCLSVQYEADVVKTNFDAKSLQNILVKARAEIFNQPIIQISRDRTHMQMYFKEAKFATMRRSELFGATDFLANCGGLLGLFLGFSFLSLIELLYFFTLRLACMFRRQPIENTTKEADRVKTLY